MERRNQGRLAISGDGDRDAMARPVLLPRPIERSQQFGVPISYPTGYAVAPQNPPSNSGSGWLGTFHFVGSCASGSNLPGSFQIDVYTMDANTLTAWVSKHAFATCVGDTFPYFNSPS